MKTFPEAESPDISLEPCSSAAEALSETEIPDRGPDPGSLGPAFPGGSLALFYTRLPEEKLSPKEVSALAHRLLRETAAHLTGIRPEELTERRSESGKPYFDRHPELFFSLSHSGHYLFFGLSREPVGVDIQEMRRTDVHRLARRAFSDEELRQMAEAEDPVSFFFRRFALREAFGKYTGEGLYAGLGRPLGEGWSEYFEIDANYAAAAFAGRPLRTVLRECPVRR